MFGGYSYADNFYCAATICECAPKPWVPKEPPPA
jgi:hypothetical protein